MIQRWCCWSSLWCRVDAVYAEDVFDSVYSVEVFDSVDAVDAVYDAELMYLMQLMMQSWCSLWCIVDAADAF